VPDDAVFSFEVEARSKKILLSLDYRSKAVEVKSHFSVKKANFTVQLVSLSKDSFVKSLRSKLHWGLDQRTN
jgi:NAD+ kinase